MNPKTVVYSGIELPVCHQLVAGERSRDPAYGPLLAGRRNRYREGALRRLQPRRSPGHHLAKSVDQLPPMMDYNIRDGRTYMYFKGDPLYPFGFGLSYTTFKYSNLKASSPQLAKDGSLNVTVDVTNAGSVAGDAVAQLYIKHMKSKVERPREELKGFQRVSIQPNETRTVNIPLKAADLAYWDEKLGKFQVESEPVSLMVGDSSADIKLDTTVQVR